MREFTSQIVDAWAHVGIRPWEDHPTELQGAFFPESDCELFLQTFKIVLRWYICVIVGLVYLNHWIFHRQAMATHHRDLSCWLWHLLVQFSVPQLFWPQGPILCKTIFPWTWEMVSGWFKNISIIYCALCFCYYYISSSDQRALDPRLGLGVGDSWSKPLDCSHRTCGCFVLFCFFRVFSKDNCSSLFFESRWIEQFHQHFWLDFQRNSFILVKTKFFLFTSYFAEKKIRSFMHKSVKSLKNRVPGESGLWHRPKRVANSNKSVGLDFL